MNQRAEVSSEVETYVGKCIFPNELQSFCCVGATPMVVDLVNGCQKRGFVCVLVQPELVLRIRAEGSNADVDTVGSNVKMYSKLFNKVQYLGEIIITHTVRSIQ